MGKKIPLGPMGILSVPQAMRVPKPLKNILRNRDSPRDTSLTSPSLKASEFYAQSDKGVAAVVCEAVEAGKAFGLEPYIREQIKSIIGQDDALIDRFIEGSVTHAGRRIYEMEAVVSMLESVDIQPFMSQAACDNLNKLLKNA